MSVEKAWSVYERAVAKKADTKTLVDEMLRLVLCICPLPPVTYPLDEQWSVVALCTRTCGVLHILDDRPSLDDCVPRADAAWEKHLGQAWARQVDLFHPEFDTATKTAFLKDLLSQTIQRGESRARALSFRSVRASPRASASRATPKNAGE